jgi:hypothetical protein
VVAVRKPDRRQATSIQAVSGYPIFVRQERYWLLLRATQNPHDLWPTPSQSLAIEVVDLRVIGLVKAALLKLQATS